MGIHLPPGLRPAGAHPGLSYVSPLCGDCAAPRLLKTTLLGNTAFYKSVIPVPIQADVRTRLESTQGKYTPYEGEPKPGGRRIQSAMPNGRAVFFKQLRGLRFAISENKKRRKMARTCSTFSATPPENLEVQM